ncbi:hypothetical protein [Salinivibrio sp. HTSP]|uniref:hypothetical protein n=1 Tax=Salinivibrio sp. HTSP TaxID=2115977 RepID=UPI000E3104D8|nr:hypothetical protein [Salinivibrio sp. HTSP]
MKNWISDMFSFLTNRKKPQLKMQRFEIEPKMVNTDVYRVDMKSLRKSRAVKKQIQAAQESFEREKATA